MKKIVIVGILASISGILGAANLADRMTTGIEMRQLELKTPERTRTNLPKTPKGPSSTQFIRSRDAHGTGDLRSFIHNLEDNQLQKLSGTINTYFQSSWYTLHKESTFADAVSRLKIGYNPSTKITHKEIKELRDIVNARLAEKGLSTEEIAENRSQSSTVRELSFESDAESIQDSTETEAGTPSQSPIDVTSLSREELRSIQAEIDKYKQSTGFRKESRFAKAVNALNINGVKFDKGWFSSAPKKEAIVALEHAVQRQLEQLPEASEAQSISSQNDSDNEELDRHEKRPTPRPSETLANQTSQITGNAQEASASNDQQINVDALIADASATGNLADKTAEARTLQAVTEKTNDFTGKQYAAAGAIGGLLTTALLSPELRSGQNPAKILIKLLPSLTPARVKTLSRAQKIALGRLVTAAIVGTAGVGSMGYGAYKMYKTAKAR